MTLSWNRKSLFEHKDLHIQKQSSSSDWPWSDKSYIVVIKDLQHQACIDQSRKGNNHTVIANSKTAPDLESLESLFSGLTWWSGWKVGKTHFWGQNWTPTPPPPPNCPKSTSCKPLVIQSWLTPQNDCKTWFNMGVLRYAYPSDNGKRSKNTIFCFLVPHNDEVVWFSISCEPLVK